ncbi:MAG: Ldh family oxidoreductase [Chloroflexi bacterium]|nr:Ldh family oxidoreductase [Chloroflexota bacterium]MXX50313.1 Ldh family oxidoreductase [Chloroflexota bacterium]MXX83782.1 Ldh family oxidoreductase [Chloroflexota bacterium]MYA94438.1 Ldh family oxidoreductase [Chloroflexota bacterium]MYC55638.1 Ldh family oxidoreductase [Chloroflexota bacterium]
MPIVQAEPLTRLIKNILAEAGARADYAAIVAEHLVAANLAGHDSHGVLRTPHYVTAIDAGRLDPRAEPDIVSQSASMAQICGNWTFGQVIARQASELAIQMAQAQGIGLVSMYHEGHTGRLGAYAEMGAAAGLASMIWDGCIGGPRSVVVPLHGTGRKVGANPIAMGLPGGPHGSLVLDFATSMSAAGKVMVAVAKDELLPDEWIVDADWQPTRDPNQLQAGGALRPLGSPSVGHKGYALGFMVGLFSLMASLPSSAQPPQEDRWGTIILMLDIARFGSADTFRQQVEAVIDYVKSDPLEGEVLVPGEVEARTRRERLASGIPLPAATWQELMACATRFGISP